MLKIALKIPVNKQYLQRFLANSITLHAFKTYKYRGVHPLPKP